MGIYDITIRRKSRATKSGYRQETVMVIASSASDAKRKAIRDYKAAGARNPTVIKIKMRFEF